MVHLNRAAIFFAFTMACTDAYIGGGRTPVRLSARCGHCQLSEELPTLGASLRGGFARVAGSTVAGVSGGSVLHSGLQMLAPAAPWVDASTNAFTLLGTTLVGMIVGILWATEAALVSSGIITTAFKASAGVVVDDSSDRLAGARALETIQATLQRLREVPGIRGVLLGAAFALCGFTEGGPAIERLAAEAKANSADDATPRAFSELVAIAVESTLAARFFDVKVGLTTFALLLVGCVDALLYLVGTLVGT